MSHAIRIHQTGGPDVLTWEAIDVPTPGAGEALIRQTASGLNYIDVYHRSGLYPVSSMPAVIGSEGAGVVEAIGDGVPRSRRRRSCRLLYEPRQLRPAATGAISVSSYGYRKGSPIRRRRR